MEKFWTRGRTKREVERGCSSALRAAESGAVQQDRTATSTTQLPIAMILKAPTIEEARNILETYNRDVEGVELNEQVLTVRELIFDQDIDLSSIKANRSLVLEDCKLNCEVDFSQASLQGVSLAGSQLTEWQGSPASIENDLNLGRSESGKGFVSDTCVDLRNTIIKGFLRCDGGKFRPNADGVAIDATNINVTRGISLADEFEALGQVKISGDCDSLDCTDGQFNSPSNGNIALNAKGLKVRRDVLISGGFRSSGEVNFEDVKIDNGKLEVSGAELVAIGGSKAFNGRGLSVNGKVTFNAWCNERLEVPFHAKGEISLEGASIDGSVSIVEGSISSPGGSALNLKDIRRVKTLAIKNLQQSHTRLLERTLSVRIRRAYELISRTWNRLRSPDSWRFKRVRPRLLDGRLDLTGAQVDTFDDDRSSWPERGKLFIDGFQYNRLEFVERKIGRSGRHKWLRLQPAEESRKPTAWTRAELALKRYGHHAEAREIGVTKEWNALRRGFKWRYFFDLQFVGQVLFGIFAGHGYKPFRTILFGAAFVVTGWFFYGLGDELHLMRPAQEEVLMLPYYLDASEVLRESSDEEVEKTEYPPAPDGYESVKPFWYSLDVFLVVIPLQQEAYWLPMDANEIGSVNREKVEMYLARWTTPATVLADGLRGIWSCIVVVGEYLPRQMRELDGVAVTAIAMNNDVPEPVEGDNTMRDGNTSVIPRLVPSSCRSGEAEEGNLESVSDVSFAGANLLASPSTESGKGGGRKEMLSA